MSENTKDKYIDTLLDDRYQLQELIGEGGMAVVYKATDNRLNRSVAVKIMRDEFAADEEFKRLRSVNENWSLFARAVGLKAEYPTAAQQKYLSTWMDDWRFSPEMLATSSTVRSRPAYARSMIPLTVPETEE